MAHWELASSRPAYFKQLELFTNLKFENRLRLFQP